MKLATWSTVVLLALTADACRADWPLGGIKVGKPFRNTPFDPGTWRLPAPPRSQESTLGPTQDAFIPPPPKMDANGSIYVGATRVAARGRLVHDARGSAWWSSDYRNAGGRVNSPVRADSRLDQPPPFVIDQSGRVFLDSTYLGQADRGRDNRSGRAAWHYQIPNGWFIYRYDDEQATRARR